MHGVTLKIEASYVPVVILLRLKLFCHFSFCRRWHCARFYVLVDRIPYTATDFLAAQIT